MKKGQKKARSGMTTERALRLAEVGFLFDCSHDRWARAVLKSPSGSECESD